MSQANNNPISDNLPVPLGTTISDLARRSGLSRTTVRRRLRDGWTPDDLIAINAIEIPECVQGLPTPVHSRVHSGGRLWNAIGRGIVGVVLVASGVTLAITSMQANAWFGFSLTTDETAGGIFATLSVTAEIVACVLPTANRFYWQDGDWWTALKGGALMCVALMVVFFAASGFVLTNVNDAITTRAERTTPTITIAQAALNDAKAARDRECSKIGPVCRQRENTVTERQRKLDEAKAEVRAAADPQAEALNVTPITLRTAKAGVMVAMCLAAGFIISFGWGLLFRARTEKDG
jgi:hypothetical protein